MSASNAALDTRALGGAPHKDLAVKDRSRSSHHLRRCGCGPWRQAIIVTLLALLPLGLAHAQGKGAAGGANQPPPTVVVEPVRLEDVSSRQTFTGRVQAIDKVRLRARVQGFLKQRGFDEGGEVKKDQLLFEIEKEPYKAALALADANLVNAKAALELAQATFDRVKALQLRGTASEAQLDDASSKKSQAEATVAAQEANVETAKLNLGYTEIRSPLTGRIGKSTYSVGELIGPQSEPLATIVAQDPMYVAFPVPQRIVIEVRREGRDSEGYAVKLQLADGSTYEHDGKIAFTEVEANSGTDTLTVRASVPNPKRILVDQQLVGVAVVAKKPERRLVVSQSSILLDQKGAYVMVVSSDGTVDSRRIVLGDQRGPDIVVKSGLAEGERVVTSGLQKVRPGIKVEVHEPKPATAAK